MNEQLVRLERLLDEWIAHPEIRPPKPPKVAAPERPRPKSRPYSLPPGTRLIEGVVFIPGTTDRTEWHVTLGAWTCDCPANRRWPPCKHIVAVKALSAQAEQEVLDGAL